MNFFTKVRHSFFVDKWENSLSIILALNIHHICDISHAFLKQFYCIKNYTFLHNVLQYANLAAKSVA